MYIRVHILTVIQAYRYACHSNRFRSLVELKAKTVSLVMAVNGNLKRANLNCYVCYIGTVVVRVYTLPTV